MCSGKQFLVATVPPADVAGVGEQWQWGVMSTPEQGVCTVSTDRQEAGQVRRNWRPDS